MSLNVIEWLSKSLCRFSLVFALGLGVPAYGNEPETIYYAGVAGLGDYKNIQFNYPVANSLNEVTTNKRPQLDEKFQQLLAGSLNAKYTLATSLANYKKGPALVIALGIEKETTSVEKFDDYEKVISEITAQILLFDFSSMELKASIPVSIARNDIFPAEEDNTLSYFKSLKTLYVGDEGESILSLASKKLVQLDMKSFYQKIRFQIDSVTFTADANKHLPASYLASNYSQIIGQYFTAQLHEYASLNLLPYVKGYAIGNKMSARLANGDVYTLKLPAPDYFFTIKVMAFKTLRNNRNQLYAAKLKLDLSEPLSDRTIFSDQFHYAVAKVIGRNQQTVDGWSAYEDAIEALLTELSIQLSAPSKNWFKQHAADIKSYQEIQQNREIFNAT